MTTQTETRRFSMHPAMLYDVILRQAGTCSKAILEGVMNSVDAGSTVCRITLSETQVVIEDDGRGFRDKDEIAKWFDVFGQPHEAAEQKTFGRFRMGRGQLFAYGVNAWDTQEFRMEVDFKGKGDQYALTVGTRKTPGCRIVVTFYEKLYPSVLEQTRHDIKLWCRWMPIPVELDGVNVANDPLVFDWTTETAEAYIELDERPALEVYNLGAHVKSYPKYTYGVGGEVVSKQALQVNFARNDVMSDCPVWRKVLPLVDAKARERNLRKGKSLDEAQRRRLARQALNGALQYSEWRDLGLFTAVTGRHYKARDLGQMHNQITVCPKGNRLGDMLHRQRIAFVLAEETLERFSQPTLTDLVHWVQDKSPYYELHGLRVVPYETLTAGLDLSYEILPAAQLHPLERVWVDLVTNAKDGLLLHGERYEVDADRPPRYATERRLCVGISRGAEGWTDAATYIAVNREFLARRSLDLDGFTRVGLLLLHECCHREPDLDDHDHTQEFFELFHDSADAFLSGFVVHCFQHLPTVLDRHNRKLTRRQLADRDTAERGRRGGEALGQTIAARAGE